MAAYLSEIIATVMRPSVAALVLCIGAGMAAGSGGKLPGGHTVNKSIEISCQGVLKPICQAF
jgi:hypothetical protein